jgi:glycine/D-amino acid oxidase-like deaminating enzyme
MYTNTPDGHFVIDRMPGFQRIFIGCGFCGHGFKFAPVVGEILADFAMHGKTDLPADFLKRKRFAQD